MNSLKAGFTLIELLVVIAIIAVLAGLLFPVFSRVKEDSKRTDCLSNERQIGMADALYVSDFDGSYPETKDPSRDPASDDADGSQDEPDYGSAFTLIEPYVSKTSTLSRDRLFACPSSLDPFGATCIQINPDVPDLTSYLVNGYFIFGLNESYIGHPSLTILFAERRSEGDGDAGPFCNYTYYPWFNPANKEAPEDDMDPLLGAVATERHLGHSNYGFPDGHVKSMAWSQTYSPPELNLHLVTAS